MRCWPRPCRRSSAAGRWCWSADSAPSAATSRRARCSAWLVPLFSWRILWFLNLPTGLALIFLNVFIPESPQVPARRSAASREAHVVLRALRLRRARRVAAGRVGARRGRAPASRCRAAMSAQTWRSASPRVAWGLINFGLLLWMPAHLVAKGYSMAVSSRPARRVGADRGADGVRRRLAVQPLEQQGRAGRLDRAVTALGLLGLIHLELVVAGEREPGAGRSRC